ncbi:MAG: hemolysin family protein [Desulfobulbus sp.]|jgi:putative hemolysin|uniref:hemolysin family protein n=1 Tax=Desulfobulbus sp. TaxID=895 RepID=UPI00284AD55F|nr:hemolysin family protein [Desulfobulbus sp.]MDR2551285.1 hemolysin family protein [Desulfobulbus sp.]
MDILLLVVLVLVNGVFAMTEIAIISTREARLRALADEGRRGARTALKLKNNPAIFLSTIQVGITMVGILSGAVGENALVAPIARALAIVPLFQPYAQAIALVVVVVVLTYFSVVFGELVPKHLGLLRPEQTAATVAPLMQMLSRVGKPLVYFFSLSADLLLRLLGAGKREEVSVTDEEIKILMEQGAQAGVFHESERLLVANVLHLDEQPVTTIMTHRQDIQPLDLTKPEPEIRQFLADTPFSLVVVCRGGLDEVAGLLRTADLLKAALACEPLAIESHLRQPLYVPEYVTTTQLLENFRRVQLPCALIVDEYGDIQGMVTLTDVLAAIVGAVPSAKAAEDQELVRREDGSWLIGGGVPIEQVKMALKITKELNGEGSNTYHTLAGFVLWVLGRIPRETDQFEEHGFRFEVVDMDNNRIDKILVTRLGIS